MKQVCKYLKSTCVNTKAYFDQFVWTVWSIVKDFTWKFNENRNYFLKYSYKIREGNKALANKVFFLYIYSNQLARI